MTNRFDETDHRVSQREAADPGSRRETFLEFGEQLDHILDHLQSIRLQLEQVPARDERERMLLDVLIAQRRDLETAFVQGMESLSAEALSHFVQFGIEPTTEGPGRASQDVTCEAFALQQTARDQALVSALTDLVPRIENAPAKDFIESIASLIIAQTRRTALGLHALRDL